MASLATFYARDLRAGTLCALLAVGLLHSPTPAGAKDNLVVMGHKVHQDSATTGPGGDVTADWKQAKDAGVSWITLGTDPLRERLFRELSLGTTSVNVGFILSTQATPQIAKLFEPLNDYLAKDPIEKWDDVVKGPVKALTFDGKIYAIPYRQATQGLHYNEALFEERGIKGPPKTIEEVLDDARKLTFTRPDGTKVYGLMLGAYTHQLTLLRAMGGEFITPDLKFGDTAKLASYFKTIRELFKDGVLPEATPTFDQNTPLEWMLQGRAAMVIYPTARNAQMNNPSTSKYANRIITIAVPPAQDSSLATAPGQYEFWAMGIPKNSKNKDLAWSFIKQLSTADNTIREALNGNGPIRASTYDDARVRKAMPYADDERKAFLSGTLPIPTFDNSTKAADIWKETFEAVMLGLMEPQPAADQLKRRIQPLLPK